MHSKRRAARRAFLFMLMAAAFIAPRAEAQYFNHTPLEAWRTATGQSAPADQSQIKRQIKRLPLTEKERLENMSQTSAVRVGCGVSADTTLAALSLSLTWAVGLAWGALILVMGILSLKRSDKGALLQFARGASILAITYNLPSAVSGAIDFLRGSAGGVDYAFSNIVGVAAVSLAVFSFIILSSPNRVETFKRFCKGLMAAVAIVATFYFGSVGISEFQNQQLMAQQANHVSQPRNAVVPAQHMIHTTVTTGTFQ